MITFKRILMKNNVDKKIFLRSSLCQYMSELFLNLMGVFEIR